MYKYILFIIFNLILALSSQAAVINIGPGGCSLVDAIKSANRDNAVGSCSSGSGTDILITPDTWFHNLTSSLPTITSNMTIRTQSSAGKVVINGQSEYRIMKVTGASTHLILTRVELINGSRLGLLDLGGAALLIEDATVTINGSRIADNQVKGAPGGAINIDNGVLNINSTLLEDNETLAGGVGFPPLDGGAIFAKNSVVEITESTFQGNHVGLGNSNTGASIFMEGGQLTLKSSLIGDTNTGIAGEAVIADISNSTFSVSVPTDNFDHSIYFSMASSVTLNHVTIYGRGRFTILDSSIFMSNSIVSSCLTSGSTWEVDSHNINISNPNFPSGCDDMTTYSNAGLRPLNDNGGPTLTRSLHPNSVLINAGGSNYCAVMDQRGEARGALCDIGAYESNEFADIAVSHELSVTGPFVSDQIVHYTAKIKNNGPNTASLVEIYLNADSVFIEEINSPHCMSFPCVINSIQSGQEISIPILMTVGSRFDSPLEITLDARSTPGSVHIDPDENQPWTNNIRSLAGSIVSGADMKINLDMLTPAPYFIGQTIKYEATLINFGPQTTTGINFGFAPIGLNVTGFIGCDTVVGLTCKTLNLFHGDSLIVTVTAVITEDEFNVTGTVVSDLLDVNLGNNIDDQQNGGGVNETDISVSMSLVESAPYYSDQYMQFNIAIKGGEEDASNIRIFSEFPGAFTISHSGCPFLPCTIPFLGAGEELNFLFDFYAPIVDITVLDSFAHRLFVSPAQHDPDLSNNEIIIQSPLNAVAETGVYATLVTAQPYYENQEVEYQIRARNGGINTATNVTISASSINLELIWAAGGQCLQMNCSLPQMLLFQEEYISLVYRIQGPGNFSVETQITADELDLNYANNSDTIEGNALPVPTIPNDLIFMDSFE